LTLNHNKRLWQIFAQVISRTPVQSTKRQAGFYFQAQLSDGSGEPIQVVFFGQ